MLIRTYCILASAVEIHHCNAIYRVAVIAVLWLLLAFMLYKVCTRLLTFPHWSVNPSPTRC